LADHLIGYKRTSEEPEQTKALVDCAAGTGSCFALCTHLPRSVRLVDLVGLGTCAFSCEVRACGESSQLGLGVSLVGCRV